LAKGGKEWRRRRAILNRQQQFLDRLVSLMKAVARESGNRKKYYSAPFAVSSFHSLNLFISFHVTNQ
jgi:hypothetical protein